MRMASDRRRDGICEEGRLFRRCRASVLGNGGADREQPDRRVLGLREPLQPSAGRSSALSAGELDKGSDAVCQGVDSGGGGIAT